jgi:hypothetical protein
MAGKIIYFTAGDVPTSGETAAIAALNTFVNEYSLTVSNGAKAPGLGLDGAGDPFLDQADFVAGTVPSIYSEVPVFSLAGRAVINDGDELTLAGTIYTFTVEGGAITAIGTADEE